MNSHNTPRRTDKPILQLIQKLTVEQRNAVLNTLSKFREDLKRIEVSR
jgi:hypothetical protein